MKRISLLFVLSLILHSAGAQTLTLDSCKAMALRSNKQLSASRVKQLVAKNARKVARTKYLPRVDFAGGWILSDREVSILNDDQKNTLRNLGTIGSSQIDQKKVTDMLTQLATSGNITGATAQAFGQTAQGMVAQLKQFGDAMGSKMVDAFRTDTRSIIVGSVMVNQPVYMGGAITAANDMARIAEDMACIQTESEEQTLLYNIDQAYWTVVSLHHKQQLADKYLALVSKLNKDVHKMIENGVATRADGLKVDVRVNEVEMTKTQVDNGLALARMYLSQLCGMPLDAQPTLYDETVETILPGENYDNVPMEMAMQNRTELQLLNDVIEMSKATTKLARASYLPQVALSAGYAFSNPNLYNGYEKKFGGMWTLGVMLHVPVWNWGESMYKVRASKFATNIATFEYDEAREKIELQVSQYSYKAKEANKKLIAAQKNIQSAEENLRCANIGFKEGVMQTTDVMAAQTAWLQAHTQLIDAQIDCRLSEAGMRKVLGIR